MKVRVTQGPLTKAQNKHELADAIQLYRVTARMFMCMAKKTKNTVLRQNLARMANILLREVHGL